MASINQAIFTYPDGGGAIATSSNHYALIAFAQQFHIRTGAKIENIVRRHDVCGKDCARLRYGPCEKCGDPGRWRAL